MSKGRPNGGIKAQSDDPNGWLDAHEKAVLKRLPAKWPKRQHDVYLTNETNFEWQLRRCESLLQEPNALPEVFLHSVGSVIPRAINLALQLQQKLQIQPNSGSVAVDMITSSLFHRTEDFRPVARGAQSDAGPLPLVHIKVSRSSQPEQPTSESPP